MVQHAVFAPPVCVSSSVEELSPATSKTMAGMKQMSPFYKPQKIWTIVTASILVQVILEQLCSLFTILHLSLLLLTLAVEMLPAAGWLVSIILHAFVSLILEM